MNSDAKNTRALKTPLSSNALLGAAALLVAGAMQTLTFSPFNLWWLGPVSVLLILLVTVPLAPEKLFRAGWLTGLGLFGSGASWVYVSISEHGNTAIPIAVLLTVLKTGMFHTKGSLCQHCYLAAMIVRDVRNRHGWAGRFGPGRWRGGRRDESPV